MTSRWLRPLAWITAACFAGHTVQAASDMLVYFGTYTGGKSKGIYVSRFDSGTGALSPAQLVAEVASPSFLALHPKGGFLYAANEVGEFRGQKAGAITAYAVDPSTGDLRPLNQQSSHGSGPCHLVVDRSGRRVLVANYGGGNVAMLPIEADGSLGTANHVVIQHSGSSVNPGRQKEPHAHSINVDPSNRYAIAADLGIDRLLVYRLDAGRGTLEPNDPPSAALAPGAGPRHFSFHPRGRYAFSINELNSTLTAFRWDAGRGVLTESGTVSTLPAGYDGQSWTAEVQVHPSGRFVYGSNRGHDSIAVFRWGGRDGLKLVECESTQGKTPRNFGIDPTGRWLLAANQASDSVVVFRIDPKTGGLEPTGGRIEVGTPVCVKFLKGK